MSVSRWCIQVIFGISLLFLFSCGKDIEKIEGYYHTEHYLNAANLAIEYYSEPKFQKRIDTFIASSGSRLLRKAMEKAHQDSLNTETDAGLVYITSLIEVFETMQRLQFNIPELQPAITEMKNLYEDRRTYFISIHYYLGIQAYEEERYQLALDHFKNVTTYASDYLDVKRYVERARQHAKRYNVIGVFYHEQLSIGEYLKKEIQGRSLKEGYVKKDPLVVQGINVSRYMPPRVREQSQKKASEYMTYIVQEESVSTLNYDYKIVANMVVKEDDFTLNRTAEIKSETVQALVDYDGVENWETGLLQYELFKSGYTITMHITVYIMTYDTNDVLDQFTVSQTNGESYNYKGNVLQSPENAKEIIYPHSYLYALEAPFSIDKRAIVEQTLNRLSVDIADNLNERIDKDLDPISNR